MKIYAIGFLIIGAALVYTGCAGHSKTLAAISNENVREIPQKRQLPARPSFTQAQRDSAAAVNKAKAAASAAKAAKIRTAKAEADSLRIVRHTPCPITEIPKPKIRRRRGCPDGCEIRKAGARVTISRD